MPDYIVCTRAIDGGSFSSEPGPTRFLNVPAQKSASPSHEVNRSGFIEETRIIAPASISNSRRTHPRHHHATQNSAPSQRRPESMLQHAKLPPTSNPAKSRKLKLELRPSPRVAASSDKRLIVAHHPSTSLDASSFSNVKRIGVAPRAGRVGLPESAPAKAVGVDWGARFLKTQPPPPPSSIPSPTTGFSTIPSSSRTSPSPSQVTWTGM